MGAQGGELISFRRPVGLGALATGVVALLVGCSERQGAAGPRSYVVRAMVAALPTAEDASLTLTQEAIPDFVDRAGERVGLDATTLPLPLAAGVDAPDVAVGDPVEVTLRVDWESEQPLELTAVRRLPAGTRLDFGRAPP
jgi:hypothetical protein